MGSGIAELVRLRAALSRCPVAVMIKERVPGAEQTPGGDPARIRTWILEVIEPQALPFELQGQIKPRALENAPEEKQNT